MSRRSWMHQVTRPIFRMRDQAPECGGAHRDISDAGAAGAKAASRPSLISKIAPATIIDALLADMIKLEWPRINDSHDKIVAAVLDVMCVSDELCWRADECANHDRTEWQQCDFNARAATAVVYNVHLHYFSRKFLLKRGKAIALRKHLC